MRLVIEREGGFTVVESDDVQDIDVRNDGVDIVRRDGDSVRLEREDHAASVALATAIALKCGTLVEPLSEQSEVDVEAAMGAASAALIRKNTTVRRLTPASEWVEGEPPRDGGLYVVLAPRGAFKRPTTASWCQEMNQWACSMWHRDPVGEIVAHMPTPIPAR